jgi:hypothetical protein
VNATRPAREGFPGSGIGNYCATKSHFPREPGTDKDAANLFVAGPDLFSAEGGVNQTFFLHALTFRAAKYIASQWDAFAAWFGDWTALLGYFDRGVSQLGGNRRHWHSLSISLSPSSLFEC